MASVSCACSTLRSGAPSELLLPWGAWSCRSAGGTPALATLGKISRGPALSLWLEFYLGCCRPLRWDFSVPLHLPSLTLCGTNAFPQLLMLLEAAWALRQQHLLGLCFPSTRAQMLVGVFCPSVPSLLQLHSPYVQTWSLSSCVGKEGYVCW